MFLRIFILVIAAAGFALTTGASFIMYGFVRFYSDSASALFVTIPLAFIGLVLSSVVLAVGFGVHAPKTTQCPTTTSKTGPSPSEAGEDAQKT